MEVFRAHHVKTKKAIGRRMLENAGRRQRRISRRMEWIKEHGPCQTCGSWDRPEIDHIDPSTKEIEAAKAIQMAADNPLRIAELAKCQVLCHECHTRKTSAEMSVLALKRIYA